MKLKESGTKGRSMRIFWWEFWEDELAGNCKVADEFHVYTCLPRGRTSERPPEGCRMEEFYPCSTLEYEVGKLMVST